MEDSGQTQRLKAAIHYTTGLLCQAITEDGGREFSRQAIAAISETAFRQCDVFAKDLEAFARHAKRNTIGVEDVKLLSRRTVVLSAYIAQKSEELALSNQNQKERRKGSGKKKQQQEPGPYED